LREGFLRVKGCTAILPPAAPVVDVRLIMPAIHATRIAGPFQQVARLHNVGNVAQPFIVSWSGGAAPAGQAAVTIPQGGVADVAIPFAIPANWAVGESGVTQVEVLSGTLPLHLDDAVVTREHEGQFRFGAGTPGAFGLHGIDASGALEAGGPAIELTTTAADPTSFALGVLGLPLSHYGTWSLPGYVAEIYVDPLTLYATVGLITDAAGDTTLPLQLPHNPSLRGLLAAYQVLFFRTSASGPDWLSSTPALAMTIQ
jgi:hypothetical protein